MRGFCYSYSMKSQNDAWFRIVSTTDRTAEVLARRHGYRSLKNLAESLPRHANVLDIGAGASTLGKEVADLRSDIHWTNLDYSYHDKQILQNVSRDAPPNLKFVAGDAAKLDDYIKPASMDAVFSYWLFPHLASYDKEIALAAASQLYNATKTDGLMVVGPSKSPMFRHPHPWGKSWRVVKTKNLASDFYSHEVLRLTNLSSASHYVRDALNVAAFEVFTTSYYVKGSNIFTRKVYDPAGGKYVPAYNPRAVYLVGKFLGRAIVGFIRPHGLAN